MALKNPGLCITIVPIVGRPANARAAVKIKPVCLAPDYVEPMESAQEERLAARWTSRLAAPARKELKDNR
jgi:hypothetical protein